MAQFINNNHDPSSSILEELQTSLFRKGLQQDHVSRLLHIARLILPIILARLYRTGLPLLPCKRRKRREASPHFSDASKALSLPSHIAASGDRHSSPSNLSFPPSENISDMIAHPCFQLAPPSLCFLSPLEPLSLYFHLCDFFHAFDIPLSSSDIFLKHGASWSLLQHEKFHPRLTPLQHSSSLNISLTSPSFSKSDFKRFCPQLTTSPLPSDSELTSAHLPSHNPPLQTQDQFDTQLVPNVFTFHSNATDVKLSGSWDNWSTSTAMYASDKNEYIALLYIPSGTHQFRYSANGKWQCDPALPSCVDADGNTNSIIDVVKEEPIFDTMEPLVVEQPLSPISSYDQSERTDFAQPMRDMPPVLELQSLKALPEDISEEITALRSQFANSASEIMDEHSVLSRLDSDSRRPRTANSPFFSHVFLNHLYQGDVKRKEEGAEQSDDQVLYLSQTSRVGGRVVNTIFVTSSVCDKTELQREKVSHETQVPVP